MACGRWRHVFVTSANPRSCKKKWPCRPLQKLLLVGENMIPKCVDCASGICEGGGSVGSYQPRHRNTRNRTDLALRPKATGNNTTLVALSRDVSPHRLHVVPLPFPLLGICFWRWCRCCHLLVSTIRVRYVASGMYVMNSTKNLKIIGFKLNDGNLFPGQIPRRVFIPGRWEMLQTSFYKLNTKDNT